MLKKIFHKIYPILLVCALIWSVGGNARATGTVNYTVDSNISISGHTYVVAAASNVDAITVSSTNIVITISGGEVFALYSPDRLQMYATGYSEVCSTDQSSLRIAPGSSAGSSSVTITFDGTTCAAGNSGGGGSSAPGSSGGGGYSASTTSTTSTTAPAAAASTAPSSPSTPGAATPSNATNYSSGQSSSISITPASSQQSYTAGAKVKFSYSYTNTSDTKEKITVQRDFLRVGTKVQLLQHAASQKVLKSGQSFTLPVTQPLSKTLPAGSYTERIKIISVGKVISEKTYTFSVTARSKTKTK